MNAFAGHVLLTLIALGSSRVVIAQFDVGVGFGLFEQRLEPGSGAGHASFSSADMPGMAWSLTYREQNARRLRLGAQILVTKRAFDVVYESVVLGGRYGAEAKVDLLLLHAYLLPEFRLDRRGVLCVRAGLGSGLRLAGKVSGLGFDWNVANPPDTLVLDKEKPRAFQGDLRALAGVGGRVPLGDFVAITIDPWCTYALGSMLKPSPGSRGVDFGLAVGVACAIDGPTLRKRWSRLREGAARSNEPAPSR